MLAIKDRPPSDRPRERLERGGAENLSLREIIALILGSGPRRIGCLGLADQLLRTGGHDTNTGEAERAFLLALASGQLPPVKGLGTAGRARLIAAFELGRRFTQLQQNTAAPAHRQPPTIAAMCAAALAHLPDKWRSAAHEWFGFVPVYQNGSIGAFCLVATGGTASVTIDPATLFYRVLTLQACGIVLFHNHPSGVLTPSAEDFDLTRRILSLCESLSVTMLGHYIVAGSQSQLIPHA